MHPSLVSIKKLYGLFGSEYDSSPTMILIFLTFINRKKDQNQFCECHFIESCQLYLSLFNYNMPYLPPI